MSLQETKKVLSLILRAVITLILLMVSFNKLSGSAEAKHLFELLGQEPVGRYLVGVLELTVIILIVTPRTVAYGGVAGLVAMTGAMLSHIKLGSVSMTYPDGSNDGGMMFMMAVAVWASSLALAFIHNRELGFLCFIRKTPLEA